jgi:very-short-patch-repair endonuclease
MTKPRLSQRDPNRIEFARTQREHANEFSLDVWQMIRAGRMFGEKFRREYPLGPYTLDFVCVDLKLDIEIDGKDHLTDEGKHHDSIRDAYLQRLGFSILRINGFRVTQDPTSVRTEIENLICRLREMSPSPPAPLPEAGRGE